MSDKLSIEAENEGLRAAYPAIRRARASASDISPVTPAVAECLEALDEALAALESKEKHRG